MAWECKTLEECTEYITDGDHQPAPKSDEGVLFIKIKDIKENRIDFKEALHVPQVYYDGIQQNRKPVVGDTLYTVVGSYGLSAYVNFDIPFCFERNIALLHPQKNVDSRFLFYSVSSPDFFKQAENAANGAAQKLIPLSRLKKLKIQLPSLEIQKKIVDILSSYDNLIENNQKQIKLLEEAAQRLYKQWFIDLKFPGHETTKIVDGLPEGWKKRIISEVCETIGGGTPSTSKQEYYHNGKIPWATPTDLTKNDSLVLLDTEKKITEEGLKHSSAKLLPCNSILMTSRASIGYFAICDFPVCTNQGFISCIPYNSDMFYYLLFNLMCRVDEIKGKATGSTFLEITKREFRNMEIVEPSESLLKNFSKIIEPIVNKIRTVKKEIVGLTQSRDRLLPKLMNNEIEV